MEKEEKGIAGDIETLNRQVEGLQRSIADEEIAYAKKKENLKQLFQSYQRMGPGSYLEIILESNDLTDFLRRINILRDITSNTGKLIEQLQSSREKQAKDKTKLTEKVVSMEGKQVQFNESLAKGKQLKKDMEDYLASLSEERENYQKYLTDIQNKWDELKPVFAKTVQEFSSIIEKGNLPPDTFKVSFDFLSIKGSIDDKILNEIIASDPSLSKMVFSFQQGNVEMKMPEKNLVLDGTFVIQEGNALRFQVKEGSFYGIPLETAAIKELFQEGDMVINLKSLLGSYTLHSIEIMDGYLEFSISPQF
ncbi:MAG: coiled-coil domain-containing protein [Desulfitobacteriaceae bacterium]